MINQSKAQVMTLQHLLMLHCVGVFEKVSFSLVTLWWNHLYFRLKFYSKKIPQATLDHLIGVSLYCR